MYFSNSALRFAPEPNILTRVIGLLTGPISARINRNRPDWSASEQEIVESLTGLEQDVLDAAASEDSLRYEDPDRIEILRDVLRAALADKLITFRELNLLRTLRDSLGLSEAVFRIVLAQLEHFPQRGNVLHTPSECRDVLNKLQWGGIVRSRNSRAG